MSAPNILLVILSLIPTSPGVYFALIVVAVMVLTIDAIANAPLGYEDDMGFHYL